MRLRKQNSSFDQAKSDNVARKLWLVWKKKISKGMFGTCLCFVFSEPNIYKFSRSIFKTGLKLFLKKKKNCVWHLLFNHILKHVLINFFYLVICFQFIFWVGLQRIVGDKILLLLFSIKWLWLWGERVEKLYTRKR